MAFPSVFVAAWGAFALGALLFLVAAARREGSREYARWALLCVMLGVRSVALLEGAERLAAGALIVTACLLVHSIFSRRSRALVVACYLTAAAVIGVGYWLLNQAIFATVSLLVGTFATLLLLADYGSAYLSGDRQGLGILGGGSVLLVALAEGLLHRAGVIGTSVFSPLGPIALVAGLSTKLAAERNGLSRELSKRREDLRTRTRELQRSYDDLRTAQEELVRKEQLAAVGELAAVIAHEVRNPLAIITNAVSSLRKGAALGEEERGELLSILNDEASRLNRIVADLLRYARPLTVQRSFMALSELCERALSLARKHEDVKVNFTVDVDDARVWVDANLLRQVLDNLVDNAVQAMGNPGGTLTMRIRVATELEDALAIDIIDTGEGMPTAVRIRAKDPFFTTRPAGTGLGLAIVDRIVDAHGGQFVINSRSGEGTRVTVLLPKGMPSDLPPSGLKPRVAAVSERRLPGNG